MSAESFEWELLGPVIRAHPRATMTYTADFPTCAGVTASWPEQAPGWLKEVLVDRGIEDLWTHQAAAASLTREGAHCVIAADTASGKSLGYPSPVLTELPATSVAIALYPPPAKALGVDQLDTARAMVSVLLSSLISPYDGDTPQNAQRTIHDHACWVLISPDTLHVSVFGNHVRWAWMLHNLRYIVVDECHAYRGAFGTNAAQILRRPLWLFREHGALLIVIFASATTDDPADQVRRLTGELVETVTEDDAPVGGRTITLWEPDLLPGLQGENGVPVCRPAPTEATDIVAGLLVKDAHTLTLTHSRGSAEKVALDVHEYLEKRRCSGIAERIESYRAGYLTEERHGIEYMLDDSILLGAVTTNAPEPGIDVGGLDVVAQTGFPGIVASFWRQTDRASRRGQGALVVLMACDDPIDTYSVHNPSALLDRPVEKTVFDPRNPYAVWSHLHCAAVEKPAITSQPWAWGILPAAEDMVSADWSHKCTWEGQGPAYCPTDRDKGPRIVTAHDTVNVRDGDGREVTTVDQADGQLLSTTDLGHVIQQAHDGAICLHRGESYLVGQLDFGSPVTLVHPGQPRYSISSHMDTTIRILDIDDMHRYQGLQVTSCQVRVSHQVTSYLRHLDTGEILDNVELDYPPRCLVTRAVAYIIPESTLHSWGVGSDIAPGALHIAEYATIDVLPLTAACDRWDIGGVSTVMYADIRQPTVLVYGGYSGGVGSADRGYRAFAQWVRATRDVIVTCECESGCPSCIQSFKCGNGNDLLDKADAIRVLSGVSRVLNDGQQQHSPPLPALLWMWPFSPFVRR